MENRIFKKKLSYSQICMYVHNHTVDVLSQISSPFCTSYRVCRILILHFIFERRILQTTGYLLYNITINSLTKKICIYVSAMFLSQISSFISVIASKFSTMAGSQYAQVSLWIKIGFPSPLKRYLIANRPAFNNVKPKDWYFALDQV